MLNRLLHLSITVFIFAILAACGSNDEPTPPAPKETHRTVLVYMVADNNLGSDYHYDQADMKEMLTGVKNGGLNGGRLLIYRNRPGTAGGNAPQMLEVTPEGITELKTYPDDPEIYSVSADRMKEVLADMKSLAPAGEYGLVLWGHATSWLTHPSDLEGRSNSPIKRSYGTDRDKWMSLSTLGETLAGEEFCFIYFDCCLMGTVEVAYELRHVTPVIVASPTELEGEGMPYDRNIAPFFASGEPKLIDAATNTFDYYNSIPGRTCQMVVINTAALDGLAEASRAVFSQQTDFPESLWSIQELSKAHRRFFYSTSTCSDCHPVYDMDHYISTIASPELYSAWTEALNEVVLYKATTQREFTGINVTRYCGLGSYVVRLKDHGDYHGYTQTQWWKDVVSKAPVLTDK